MIRKLCSVITVKSLATMPMKLAKLNDYDSDPVLLMITTSEGTESSNMWCLDTDCSNHMTGKNE